ncbi:MAG: hypothetical protein ACXWZS_04965 [Gemmatirosa sp.]
MRDATATDRNAQRLLRRVLLVDAVATAGMGALLAAAPAVLDALLGLPTALMRGAALALLPFAALLAWVARRPRIPAGVAWALIACNVLWAVDSVLLPLTGWIDPTPLGAAFVVAQGLVVAVFAWLEWTGLRRAAPMPA